jgi:hypothetical protein
MYPIQFKPILIYFGRKRLLILLICLLSSTELMAHSIFPLHGLLFFREPLAKWTLSKDIQTGISVHTANDKYALYININNINPGNLSDSVLIDAISNTVIRSFSDLPGGIRITHAVNVGSPAQVHYTYDLDKGMIVQVWQGRFLNASTMWIGRGDGSYRPHGTVKYLGKPVPAIEKLNTAQAVWAQDTAGTGFKPKGYVLNAAGQPTFRYIIYGSPVNDATTVMANGKGIHREIILQKQVDSLFMHLATGNHIEMLSDGSYAIDDKSYYIRIDDAGENKPVIREASGKQELIIPIQKKLTYSIIF